MIASLWVALALVFATQSAAPAKPDFNGRWIAVGPKQVEGQTLTVTQTDATLRMELVSPEGEYSALYFLDGKMRTVPPQKKDDKHGDLRLAATWDKNKLLLTDVSLAMGYYPIQRAMSLDRDGHLVLELRTPRTAPDQEPGLHSERITDAARAVFKRDK